MNMNSSTSLIVRDKRKNIEDYSASIQEVEEVYTDLLSETGDCVDKSMAARLIIESIRLGYVLGNLKDGLKPHYIIFVETLISSEKCFGKEEERYSPNDIDLTSVRFVSSTIVYGECLGFSQSDLPQISECIPSGIEQLVDRLLSYYQPDRTISEALKEKGKYKQLIAIMDSDDKAYQAKKLKNYLDQWPKKLGIRAPDGIRPLHETPTYDGYWCYEAAAVVIVCDIDDESFKDHEFYPSELMSWREQSI